MSYHSEDMDEFLKVEKLVLEAMEELKTELQVWNSDILRNIFREFFRRRFNGEKLHLFDIVVFNKEGKELHGYEKELYVKILASILKSLDINLDELRRDERIARTFLALLKGLIDFGSRIPPTAPYTLSFEITYRCNLNCKHCYIGSRLNQQINELTLVEIKQLARDVADAGFQIVGITGGEPLVRPDVVDIVKEFAEYNIAVNLDTNGTLLTPEIARRLVKAGLKVVLISLDSVDPQKLDYFRGGKSVFERVDRAIDNSIQIGLPVYLDVVLSKLNLHELDKIVHYAAKKQISGIAFIYPIVIGRATELDIVKLTLEDLFYVSKKLIELQKEYHDILTIYFGKLPGEHYVGEKILTKDDLKILLLTGGDQDGRMQLNITPEGDIYPSCYLRIKVGNVREQSFKDIWYNSPILETLRNRDLLRGRCGKCLFKYLCGGSRARAYAINGNYLAEDPVCSLKIPIMQG